ncbi:hypothetical protein V9T40_000959 [Parthenolecanium corni]|uniref:Conserved oligomeric Golgi complex subunit 5 n=1 Tax=Parthenolecanium corni TaxID=536013 RepID=A0AAN9Y252_9HEMI
MGGSNKIKDTETWKTFENDSYLSQFLTASVSKNTEESITPLNCSLTASEQLSKLTKGINLLEKELLSLVHHKYRDLITQGTWVEELENTLKLMRTHLQELQKSAGNMRDQITEPINEIKKQCQILTRLHDTSNILRCIIQVQQFSKNISKNDMFKASSMIKEVDDFCQDVNLSDIEILKNDLLIIEKTRLEIQTNAKKGLIEALNNESESQAAPFIQVFINLKELNDVVQNIKESALLAIKQATKTALDIKSLTNQSAEPEKKPAFKSSGPGRVTGHTFPGVNVAAFRTKLWSNWNNLLETIVYPKCAEMYVLCLTIIRSNLSALNSEFYDAKCDELDFTTDFWNQVLKTLSTNLIAAAEESSFIKQALENEYPKWLRFHTDLNKKLKTLMKRNPMPTSKSGHQSFNVDNHFAEQFENAYLSRSLSRLLDGVHGMFSSEDMPHTEDIDVFIGQVAMELEVSLFDENLCLTIARNIGKAIRLFCLKCEQLAVHDGEASQVISAPSATQQLNTSIANNAFYLKQQIDNILNRMSSKLPENCKSEIIKIFVSIDEIEKNIIEPIVNSISEAIDSIIITIHRENFELELSHKPTCSLYLRELHQFISRAYAQYLEPFKNQDCIEKHCFQIANRCLELFIRHICLVRPILPGGRQKLQEDFNKIEPAIAPLCPEINKLGHNFKILRAFRSLIMCSDPQQIVDSEYVGKIVPFSLALMFLFSYAPAEIPSPRESCNWSAARLSQWLDNHGSERERLELISGALQRYQQDVRQQNKTTFHETYPVIMSLLQKGFDSLKRAEER